jgi:hypothetical protein
LTTGSQNRVFHPWPEKLCNQRELLQLAWRWLRFQKESELTKWFRTRTADARRDVRKTMIVALARKLLIALGDT